MTTIDPTTALFTVEPLRFEDHDDDAANDLEHRLQELGEAIDVWVGQGLTRLPAPSASIPQWLRPACHTPAWKTHSCNSATWR